MAPKASAPTIQRQGMPPARPNPQQQQQSQSQKPQPPSSQPSRSANATQAARPTNQPPQPQQPPNPFQTLNSTTIVMLQQIGYVLSGPGRLEDRRDTFNTMYKEVSLRFQQVADRLEDEVVHAMHMIRGQYAVFLETQQEQERKLKEEAEEEQVRKKNETEREAEQRREAGELEMRDAMVKQDEDEEKTKTDYTEIKKDVEEDVIMIDSPAMGTEAPAISNQATSPIVAESMPAKASFEAPIFPDQDPDPSGTNNTTADTEFDIEALFGSTADSVPLDPATDAINDSLTGTVSAVDPSADDLASLIPGIESYASMDQSTSTTNTAAAAAAAVLTSAPPPAASGALDLMDFSMDDSAGNANDNATGGDFGGDGDYLSFLNADDYQDDENGQPIANDGDLDDWLNAMN